MPSSPFSSALDFPVKDNNNGLNVSSGESNNHVGNNIPRVLDEDESPWVLNNRDEGKGGGGGGGEGGGAGKFVFLPLVTPVDPEVTLYEHYDNQVFFYFFFLVCLF